MQPAIPIGTVLQNHYHVVRLLGQGGFGRTYLAEDQGRFNERCAIKEFVPIQGEDKFSDKATQLFQREASVLYQIEHPQIPKFRATFEEEERLFLVQDYVEGPTYHEVLRQRQQQGRAFTETEVRQFLQQILPVLAHIHAKGIIHRDVSPDNIILRQQDNLPVLIDFGVVKEVVTRMQLDGVVSHATTVGKAGYAPAEQMQTGRAYPSSDLYALAVTAIVLLTGKEPQMLFDDVSAAWTWQQWVSVEAQLAAVLNKALSFRPGDRFQSVSEMAQALRSTNRGASNLASGIADASRVRSPQSPQPPPVSQMKTVAVGRAAPSTYTVGQNNPTLNRPTTVRQPGGRTAAAPGTHMVVPPERERSASMLENPLAVGGLAIGLAAIAGFGGWAVVKGLDNAVTPTPTITSLPPLGSETTPTPTPTPTQVNPKPAEYEQPPLGLVPGETKIVEGNMRQGDKVNYPFVAEAGQLLNVEQTGDDVRLSVLGPNGEPINRRADGVFAWSGELAESGEYRVQLSPVRGVKIGDYRGDYRLSVTLSDPAPVEPDIPEPTAPPIRPGVPDPTAPPVQPQVQSQRVSFPSGAEGIAVANEVGPGRIRRYVVNAKEGQILSVQVTDSSGGRVDFDVLMPGGEMIADASGIVWWEGLLPVGGDYAIDVQADQSSEFTLQIKASAQLPSQ
ncbi:MAG: serine/threonine-protein kinase [Phormidesmis sp.]